MKQRAFVETAAYKQPETRNPKHKLIPFAINRVGATAAIPHSLLMACSADDGADSEEDSDFDDITSPAAKPPARQRGGTVGGSKRKPAAAGPQA